MLESALARLLHHHLGKYILDFDADNLNVGIFSGDIRLTDLILKPEALYELDLPIAVKYGKVESILINIPWSFLKSKPVTVTVQGIWLIAEPCTQNGDAAREKRLIRAARQNILNGEDAAACVVNNLFAQLFAAIQYNLQISMNDVHLRYEDDECRAACGLCIQSITLQTTDRKWKQLNENLNSASTFQILKMESISTYWDSAWQADGQKDLYTIRNELANGLKTFQIHEKPFDFLLKPAMLKLKITIRRVNDQDNHIQVDGSFGDLVMQASQAQIKSMQTVYSLLKRLELLRKWIAFRPTHSPVQTRKRWQYAYEALVAQRVRPYTWPHIKHTRGLYKQYRQTYMQSLQIKQETELKLDLLKLEDSLSLSNIILAREEAKIMLLQQQPDQKNLMFTQKESVESLVHIEKPNNRFKLNLAIGNVIVSLSTHEQEIFSVHISQLAICAETNSVSLRLHTILVEGISCDDHLAPVVCSSGYDSSTPTFAVEIKKNPFEGQYNVLCNLESLEFTYNEFLISELYNFLNAKQVDRVRKSLIDAMTYTLPAGMDVNLCIKKPKFLFPESGNLQKGSGSMLVISPGLVQATREGTQDPDLEAGIAELEERLYTRWSIQFADAQVLLVESGDAWREALDLTDSQMHFLHQMSGEILILFNTFQIDKRLPLRKYNLSLNNLKITSSTNKVTMLLDIIGNLPLAKPRKTTCANAGKQRDWSEWRLDQYNTQSELDELKQSIYKCITTSNLAKQQQQQSKSTKSTLEYMCSSTSSDVTTASDCLMIDDTLGWGARAFDLPGFEDNISSSNQIQTLLRFTILESCITISRISADSSRSTASNNNERSFLQLRMGRLCFEGAALTYGPAIQFNLESILITEQFHTGPAGQYLELIASGPGEDILSVLYRKVTADCPEFRSHFRSVENSLVIDVGHLRLRWRTDACRAVVRYLRRFVERTRNSKACKRLTNIWRGAFRPHLRHIISENDPPIPPGAVKFNRSVRVASTRFTFADSQTDVLDLLLCGVEYDHMFKANEKVQLRLYLNACTMEDLSHLTLYPKILGMEEDYVLELKYVGHTSHVLQHDKGGMINVPCDGNLRLQVGRVHVAPLGAKDLARLIRPIPLQMYLQLYLQKLTNFLAKQKLLFSFQLGGPTLLIPQKLDSPNVILIHKGDIIVENFYSETANGVVDNILIKIEGASVSRAVMSLGGSLQLQGNLLEPMSIRLDIKHNMSGVEPIWSITGSTDTLRITVGQCDVTSLMAIYNEYYPKVRVASEYGDHARGMSELHAFLSQQSLQQRVYTKFIVDGFCVELVSDCDEILSSPVRDMNRTLCRCTGNEMNLVFVLHSDASWRLNSCLKDLMFTDTKSTEATQPQHSNRTSILKFEYVQTNALDTETSLHLNSLHLKLSTLLITHLYQFVVDCVPGEWPLDEGGLENQGYEKEPPLPGGTDAPGGSTHSTASAGSTVQIKLNPFTIDVVSSTDARIHLTFGADLLQYYQQSVESYLDVERVCLEVVSDTTREWVVEPFDVKFIYNATKLSAMLSETKINISPCIVHCCIQLFDEVHAATVANTSHDFQYAHHDDTRELDDTMWLPKKLAQCERKVKKVTAPSVHLLNDSAATVLFVAPSVAIVMHVSRPLLVCRVTCDLELRDHCNIQLTVQSNYYNLNNNTWEPLLEPIGSDFRPYELNVHVFRAAALPVTSSRSTAPHDQCKYLNRVASTSMPTNVSDTSGDSDDSDSNEIMSFMRPPAARVPISPSPTLLGGHGEYDSDAPGGDDDDAVERITSTLSYLFTSDSSDDADSDGQSSNESIEQAAPGGQEEGLEEQHLHHLNKIQEIATYVIVGSKDQLELTLTSQSVQVLHTVVASLAEHDKHVVAAASSSQQPVSNVLVNELGARGSVLEMRDINDMVICSTGRRDARFDHESSNTSSCDELELDEEAQSQPLKKTRKMAESLDVDAALATCHKYTTSELYKHVTSCRLHIKMSNGLGDLSVTCPTRSCRKLLRLHPTLHGLVYYIALNTSVSGVCRTVTLHSPLQVRNETSYVLGILYQSDTLKQLNVEVEGEAINPFEGRRRITLLQPNDTFHVPLFIAYHCKLYVQPAHLNSSISGGVFWSDVASPHIEQCRIKLSNDLNSNNGGNDAAGGLSFYVGINTKSNLNEYSNANAIVRDAPSIQLTIPAKTIFLLPPLIINNCLPRDIKLLFGSAAENNKQYHIIETSACATFYRVNPVVETKIIIEFEYYGHVWLGSVTLAKDVTQRMVTMSCLDDTTSERLQLLVRANWKGEAASCHLYIHAPFWILNRTDLDLQIKGCGVDTVCTLHQDTPALWTWPRGIRRKCIRMRVGRHGAWSTAFPIDTPACVGRVVCRDRARAKKYRLLLKTSQAKGTPLTTLIVVVPMFVVTNHTEAKLRFMEENENADLWFDIAPGETTPYWPETDSMHMYIKYEDSAPSARGTTSQRFPITKQQHTVLRMGRSMAAVCVSVTGGETASFVICICTYRQGNAPLLIVNRCGDLFLKFNQKGLCQTALLSPHHSLLYTWDEPSAERQLIWNVYNNKGRGYELQFNEDCEGEQVVEDSKANKVYVAWICFMDGAQCTAVFAQNKKVFDCYKHLECAQLEVYASFKSIGLSLVDDAREVAYVSVTDRPAKWEVSVSRKWKELTPDLSTWIEEQYQWNRHKCDLKEYLEIDLNRMLLVKPFFGDLRRSYASGVWLQYRQSATKHYAHLEIQNVQVDNQLTSSAGRSQPVLLHFTDKHFPCIEVFSLWSSSNRTVYACSVQIRDCSVALDAHFLKYSCDLVQEFIGEPSQAERSRADLKVLYSPLATRDYQQWRIYQLSFAAFTVEMTTGNAAEFIKHYYDGGPYQVVQDKPVLIRMSSIDIRNTHKSFQRQIEVVAEHYRCNAAQQLYALLLGQTVLLNPHDYGANNGGDKGGIELESLGSVGLSEAAKRLLGHIRGAEPPHTATLFPPHEYIGYKNTRASSDITEATLIISGLCGSGDGSAPSNGSATVQNSEHLLRTVLRNLLAFSQHDTFDCTGLLLEALRRSHPNIVMRTRLPRVCDPMYLEAFSWRRAVGQYLLHEIIHTNVVQHQGQARCTYIDPEREQVYWAHASVDASAKHVVVISFTNVYVVRKKQLWSGWDVEWKVGLDSIVAIPTIENNTLIFSITEDEGDRLGSDKYTLAGEPTSLTWLKNKIEEVMILKIEDEQWCA